LEQNHQPAQSRAGGGAEAPRKRKKKRRGNPAVTVLKVLGTLFLVGVTTCAILACFAVVYINTVIIPQSNLDLYDLSMNMSLSTTMYYKDRETGELKELRTIHGSENRIWISYDDIPKDLINATIAIEDKRFETHHGVDWLRTGKAVLLMFTGGSIQGGSTITQQLIKNMTENDDVTVKRKITEIFQALELEKNYTKDVILEWYLNKIYLGQGCYGVYTASYAYFGKNIQELSLAECASLIGITNNPSLYDPYRHGYDEDGNVDPDWGRKNNANRALNVLYQMLDQEKITQEEYDEAEAQVKAGLNFTNVSAGEEENQTTTGDPYTWYEDLVIRQVIKDLVGLGYDSKTASDMVYLGGLSIETCIDPDIQAVVDQVYGDVSNLDLVSSSGQQLQSGMVIVDPNGDVVAVSGGMGEKEGSLSWSRASNTKRPPGSSFKPLSVYAPAIEAGLITPSTVFDDAPYRLEGDNAWPVNADYTYRGRMSVLEALQRSSNPVAVRVLSMLSPQESFNFLTGKLGFEDDLVYSSERYGQVFSDIDLAPLAMGGLTDGVSVLNMAAAYSIFPRDGVYLEPRVYTVVRNSSGKVILDNASDRVGVPVLSEKTTWYMNYLLKNVVARGTGTAARFDGMTIAGKTGTTTSQKDLWFVGYTPYYTAAVWVGYDQQERIAINGSQAMSLWKKVMEPIHAELENKDFSTPDGLVQVGKICASSGMLQTDYCLMDPRGDLATSGWLFKENANLGYCTVHTEETVVEVCTDCPILNKKGEETGMYYLAGEFCPEESRKTVCLMNTDRPDIKDTLANDYMFTKQYIDSLGDGAYCTVHDTPPEPEPYDPMNFNPFDETTWPTEEQWPGFTIEDPTTWPFVTGPGPDPGPDEDVTPPPDVTDAPGPGPDDPGTDVTPPPEVTDLPSPDDDEPYVPAA